MQQKYNIEFLQSIALKYATRYHFKQNGGKYYEYARRMGWLNTICKHMIPMKVSIPQKICKQIFDILLNENGIYNDRKTITPLELDIYYPKCKIAVEFQGLYWHNAFDSVKNKDFLKKKKCEECNILLLIIHETKKSHEDQIPHIKEQIIKYIDIINKTALTNISSTDVNCISINFDKIYEHLSWNHILSIISKCNSMKELIKFHSGIYSVIKKTGKDELLDSLRKRKKAVKWKNMSDDEIITYIKKDCLTYLDAYNIPAYQTILIRRKLTSRFREETSS